ncbi:MAG TPA: hypothetical protein VHM70_23495 [Polyangiaceae bacterium]|nr:hypothetical protein [Polyangiaceae bacterium]
MALRHRFVLSLGIWLSACSPSAGQRGAAQDQSAPLPSRDRGALPPATNTAAGAASSEPTEHPPSDGSSAAPSPLQPTLLITDPSVLRELEQQGLGIGALFGVEQGREALSSLATLARSPMLRPLFDSVRGAVSAAESGDPLAGVSVQRFSHRLFDVRFLSDPDAELQLVAVVNRMDRAAIEPNGCGELRLIYRLGYRHGSDWRSRLPLTVGVELQVPKLADGCRSWAKRWLEPPFASAAERAVHLLAESGPLSVAPVRLDSASTRVVLNAQVVRWPSTVRPDLGGHAEYALRSFRLNAAGVLTPEPLENTIDVSLLQRSPAKRKQLAAWLSMPEQLNAAERGTLLVPSEYLAKHATSFTPRGLNRLANRPFSSVFDAKDFKAIDFGAHRQLRSAEALLRRLDQASCPGCHQARSVAGFHLLGEDDEATPSENALALPVSPHVLGDLARREQIVSDWANGSEPDLGSPFPEHTSPDPGNSGAHCGLGIDPTFEAWTCGDGLRCVPGPAAAEAVGECAPSAPGVGDACELAQMKYDANPKRDRISVSTVRDCPSGAVCNRSDVGFPAGMCTAPCGAPDSACGAIAVLDPFNACIAKGLPFVTCIRQNTTPAGLRTCDASKPCRDDYVCARGAADRARSGMCIPPYFVFQLRVDGHAARPNH